MRYPELFSFIFSSIEARPFNDLWIQLYTSFARRGEVDLQSINRQYRQKKVGFLYKSYNGDPEKRSVVGISSVLSLNDWCRINIDIFSSNWYQHELFDSIQRANTSKFDGYISILIGF